MNGGLALLIDAVIAFTLLEGVALVALWRGGGSGVAPREVLMNLASGICLMLALRCAVRQTGSEWLLLCLLAAGAAHAADLHARWRPAATMRTPR